MKKRRDSFFYIDCASGAYVVVSEHEPQAKSPVRNVRESSRVLIDLLHEVRLPNAHERDVDDKGDANAIGVHQIIEKGEALGEITCARIFEKSPVDRQEPNPQTSRAENLAH